MCCTCTSGRCARGGVAAGVRPPCPLRARPLPALPPARRCAHACAVGRKAGPAKAYRASPLGLGRHPGQVGRRSARLRPSSGMRLLLPSPAGLGGAHAVLGCPRPLLPVHAQYAGRDDDPQHGLIGGVQASAAQPGATRSRATERFLLSLNLLCKPARDAPCSGSDLVGDGLGIT